MNMRLFALMALLSGSALACAAATPMASAQGRQISVEEYIPQLAVRGSAELEKPADELQISIGVVTEHADATEAMSSNSTQMQDVVKALEKVGLTKEEYETGRFRIQPRYAQRDPRRSDPDWSPRIVGYHVSNSVRVKTGKLDLAGQLIEAANKAGANSIDNISFGLADSRKYRAEAITDATTNAMNDAKALAEAAGLRLVRVLSISLDDSRPSPPIPMHGRMAMESSAADTPPIAPGDVTVRATVNVVYEIAPR